MEQMVIGKNECDRCGTCCEKGGPTLHSEDRSLLEHGILAIEDLVTIRDGELVIELESGRPEPLDKEFIKVKGHGADWCCRFLHPVERLCTIYDNRPLACRLLKCWDPAEVSKISGRQLVDRLGLIEENDPLLPLVRLHQQLCIVPDLIEIKVQLRSPGQRGEVLERLTRMVDNDLRIRAIAAEQFDLPVSREIFYFGRPLFQLLAPFGVGLLESGENIQLSYTGE